jgi:hypothetical protein
MQKLVRVDQSSMQINKPINLTVYLHLRLVARRMSRTVFSAVGLVDDDMRQRKLLIKLGIKMKFILPFLMAFLSMPVSAELWEKHKISIEHVRLGNFGRIYLKNSPFEEEIMRLDFGGQCLPIKYVLRYSLTKP